MFDDVRSMLPGAQDADVARVRSIVEARLLGDERPTPTRWRTLVAKLRGRRP